MPMPLILSDWLTFLSMQQWNKSEDPSGALRAFIDWVLTGSAAHERASFLCCACCICSLNIGLCVVSTCSNDRVSCLQSVHCGRCPADSHSWIPLSFSLCISCVATFSDLKLHHHLESIEVERDLFLSSFPFLQLRNKPHLLESCFFSFFRFHFAFYGFIALTPQTVHVPLSLACLLWCKRSTAHPHHVALSTTPGLIFPVLPWPKQRTLPLCNLMPSFLLFFPLPTLC